MKKNFLVLSLAASLAGVPISVYLLAERACVADDFFACSPVLSSGYSQIYGFPVAGLGLIWFLASSLMAVAGLVGSETAARQLFYWSILGVAGVAFLVMVEVVLIGAICPLCTAAHLLGLSIFASSYLALE